MRAVEIAAGGELGAVVVTQHDANRRLVEVVEMLQRGERDTDGGLQRRDPRARHRRVKVQPKIERSKQSMTAVK